ncbi:hypothetical protein JTE90_010762 [Oedothorax gibbosus]|uniref:CCHC-type domain-containing protein n=1 Tax=Oedothorax gibbosus TaxID=931172 RepID=A0AAV6TQ04_9ARAC|nr:hypothetical protein JTE90_010762 [Oedothorax gibbosus]
MEKNFGIFIRSEYQGKLDFLIKQCQELLKRVNSEATIKHIQSDNIRKGIVVRFDRDVSESQLLKTKYLCDDSSATVHSLTTSLVVLEAYPDNEVDFVEDVRKQLLKIWNMKVLDVKKIPLSEQFPYIGTGKYVVILQVPEVEELEEFKAMGLPDGMVLELPSCDEKLKVKFYCRRCLEEGHVQSSCANQFDNHVSTTSKRSLQGDQREASNPEPKKQRAAEPEAGGIGKRRNEFSTEDVYPDLEIVNVSEGNSRDGRTESHTSAPNLKNNQNQLDNHVSTTVLNQTSERPLEEDQSEVSNPKTKTPRGPEPEVAGIGERGNELSTADVYPDLEIVNVSEGNSRDGRTESHTSAPNLKNNSSTPDKFPTQPTNHHRRPPSSKIIIPIGIRKIMCGLPNPVLDVDTLETLFNNTKKRANVHIIIKDVYTTNIKGLRQQLKDTIKKCHKHGSLEDKNFAKWIEKFLKRI